MGTCVCIYLLNHCLSKPQRLSTIGKQNLQYSCTPAHLTEYGSNGSKLYCGLRIFWKFLPFAWIRSKVKMWATEEFASLVPSISIWILFQLLWFCSPLMHALHRWLVLCLSAAELSAFPCFMLKLQCSIIMHWALCGFPIWWKCSFYSFYTFCTDGSTLLWLDISPYRGFTGLVCLLVWVKACGTFQNGPDSRVSLLDSIFCFSFENSFVALTVIAFSAWFKEFGNYSNVVLALGMSEFLADSFMCWSYIWIPVCHPHFWSIQNGSFDQSQVSFCHLCKAPKQT